MRIFIIKIIIYLLALLGFNNLASAIIQSSTCESIEYNLNLIDIKDSVLKVEVIIRGDFKNNLALDLPSTWASAYYYDQIKNIQTDSGFKIKFKKQKNLSQTALKEDSKTNTKTNTRSESKEKSTSKEIPNTNSQKISQAIIELPKKSSTKKIKITYEIHQKQGNPSDVHEAIIRKDIIHSPGYGIFITPSNLNENDKVSVVINWINLNKDFKTLSSYGANKKINFKTTMPELLHAIYVAGNIRLYDIGSKSQPIFLSLYGNFDINDKKIKSDLKEIINSQRKFFGDSDFPYYAISLIEGENPNSMGGTNLYNSFTAFLPKKMDREGYYILFAHEHLHNWIGGKISNDTGEDERLNYWWSEGFTDFYSRLIALRSGGIDKKTFINEVNEFLQAYYLSPLNQEPNSRIKTDFWNNRDIEKLPYYRGFVFALYLNNIIKMENPNNSLDDVMHNLFNETYKTMPDQKKFSGTLFKEITSKYIKNGIEKEFTYFIDNGKIITLEELQLPIEKTFAGKYQLGFSYESLSKNKIIQEIDIKSNAYNAGLRNNQKVIGWDFPKGRGNQNQIIAIKTIDKTFEFKPEHYNKVEVYKIKTKFSRNETRQFNKFFDVK